MRYRRAPLGNGAHDLGIIPPPLAVPARIRRSAFIRNAGVSDWHTCCLERYRASAVAPPLQGPETFGQSVNLATSSMNLMQRHTLNDRPSPAPIRRWYSAMLKLVQLTA
jgi:hypothetical protein